MAAIDVIREANFADAEITLWLFKKSYPTGEPPKFNGRWVETTEPVDDILRNVLAAQRDRIEEVEEYGILAQNNEGSALLIQTDETHAGIVTGQMAEELQQKKANTLKKVRPSEFYVIKAVLGDQLIYGFRKTDRSWKTKKQTALFYSEQRMDIDETPSMDLMNDLDFFIADGEILILNKARFESILSYKEAHADAFAELKDEAEFAATFSSIVLLDEYVGNNKIQLRRAHAIQQKGHYKDANFMRRLIERYKEYGLNLNFTDDGKIIPCAETCRDIFQALLDHRLASGFSKGIYDVPHAMRVGV
ncbi:MAG: DUF4868 domain-containing protein [Hyphobacterium sp.]|nr:MAG: DUF4868 domain-containing protein [Hyphobacterium sp.]